MYRHVRGLTSMVILCKAYASIPQIPNINSLEARQDVTIPKAGLETCIRQSTLRVYEEFTRLAEIRLAQNTLNYISIHELT